jgi:O-antigen/teichoic acid export membrane protein
LSGIKNLATIGFSDVVGAGMAAFFWFYIATLLEPESYGEIFYFLSIAGIVSAIATFGTEPSITVYISKNVKIQATLYFISLLAGTLASAIIIIFFSRFDIGFIIIGYILNTLTLSELLGKKLYSKYAKFNLVQKSLTLILGISFYFIFGVGGIIFALALSYLPFTIIIYNGFKYSKIDFSLLKPRMGFLTHNYFMVLTQVAKTQADKLIILPLLGSTILGNYTLALQVVLVIVIIPQIVYKYILPYEVRGEPKKKLKRLTILTSVVISVFGMLFLPYVIPEVFPKYNEAVNAIQIMLLALIPSTISIMYLSRFYSLEKGKIILIERIIGATTLILNIIILGSMFGVEGVAVAYVLSSSIQAFVLFYVDRLTKKINYK